MKEGKETFYVWQGRFNLIRIYLNVSMPHLVPWKIQRPCTSTPGLWYFASRSMEINNNVKSAHLFSM